MADQKTIRDLIVSNLSRQIDKTVVVAIVDAYARLVSEFRRGQLDSALMTAGKFAEHILRAIEFLRTKVVPAEIKSPAATIREIEKDAALDEAIRILIPRITYAMIFDLRSKRGAVHVKQIDPRHIDTALAVEAASWVVAELLRLFHSDNESLVAESMAALVRGNLPFVEVIAGELVVTCRTSCGVEILLLLASVRPGGMDRRTIGQSSKYTAPEVTRALTKLAQERYVHKVRDGNFYLTGSGEAYLTSEIAHLRAAYLPRA